MNPLRLLRPPISRSLAGMTQLRRGADQVRAGPTLRQRLSATTPVINGHPYIAQMGGAMHSRRRMGSLRPDGADHSPVPGSAVKTTGSTSTRRPPVYGSRPQGLDHHLPLHVFRRRSTVLLQRRNQSTTHLAWQPPVELYIVDHYGRRGPYAAQRT